MRDRHETEALGRQIGVLAPDGFIRNALLRRAYDRAQATGGGYEAAEQFLFETIARMAKTKDGRAS